MVLHACFAARRMSSALVARWPKTCPGRHQRHPLPSLAMVARRRRVERARLKLAARSLGILPSRVADGAAFRQWPDAGCRRRKDWFIDLRRPDLREANFGAAPTSSGSLFADVALFGWGPRSSCGRREARCARARHSILPDASCSHGRRASCAVSPLKTAGERAATFTRPGGPLRRLPAPVSSRTLG